VRTYNHPIGPVTLVVPVRDESGSLRALFSSIQSQSRAPDEIVIVDAGSVDGTAELARSLAADDDRVRVIAAGPATPGRARNVGISEARTEWVALTDAGIELVPGWLEELESAAVAAGACDVVYGTVEPAIHSRFDEYAALAYVAPLRATPAGPIRGPSVQSCLLRRGAWEAAGGFPDLRAGEDTVFIERLERLGRQAAWAPRAEVYWSVQPNLARTFRRFRLYSYHGVLAGRESNWHHGVARIYLAGTAVLAAARMIDRRAIAILPAAGLARAIGAILARREGRPLGWALHPRRVAGVATVLATADLALFVGWAQGLLRRGR
jgi:glycosyltransferase involved in cell wall biosynthesis